jgi:hypothetical protein
MAQIGVGPGLRVADADLSFFSRVAADLAVVACRCLGLPDPTDPTA